MTALAERMLVFQITPWRDLHVSRTIEFRADQTLHNLHHMIHYVFDLDDEHDHLYAFFLNNRAWDRTFKYGGPGVEEAPHEAVSTSLGSLLLRKNKRFLYLFDFGDELRHEVRMVGEGVADANQRYPRVIESVGASPPRHHHQHDEDEEEGTEPEEPPPLDPRIAELVPGIIEALERYAPRSHAVRKAPVRPATQLREEADLAFALLERSGGDRQVIHAVEHAVEGYVWGWLCDLPLELSLAGRTDDGLRLGERVYAIVPHPPMVFTLPLLFALADRATEARDHLERNLVDYPDDSLMLLRAGEAFHSLGDLSRAEEAYREAIPWVGDDIRARREIVGGLERLLNALGREDAIAELREAEQREQERKRLEESREWPIPYRREGPKVSRNDPCPCGSGKKAKRCCGTSLRS